MDQFKDVDWNEVHERLTHTALRLFNASRFASDERVLQSFGDGFQDLPQEAILDLLDQAKPGVKWNSAVRGPATTKSVAAYLSAVLRNDYLDRVRAKRLKGQRSIVKTTDGEDLEFVVDPADPAPTIEDVLARRQVFGNLKKRLDDDFKARLDDDLQLYVMLQFDEDRYVPYTPRDAAAELGIDVEQVYLLKEKLERRLNRIFKEELQAAHAAEQEGPYEQKAR